MHLAIRRLDQDERHEIRDTVAYARSMWPNDGGDEPPRCLLRRAFKFLRYEMIERRLSASRACSELYMNAQTYEDM